jgi:aspartyl-tRNA(Asn)/glutamyl-tRNA(Gln) amidotransferase subunit C
MQLFRSLSGRAQIQTLRTLIRGGCGVRLCACHLYLRFGVRWENSDQVRPQMRAEMRVGTKNMAEKVTTEDVERVAELARLKLAPEEVPRMQKDLNAILDYVAELNEVDTAGVAPLEQMGELGGFPGELRPDALVPSLQRAGVMREAPESDGSFFKVPKVIER